VQGAVGEPSVEIERARLQFQPDKGIERIGEARHGPAGMEPTQTGLQPFHGSLVDRGDPGKRLVDVGANL
jgi:hypothetical protein